MDPALLPGTGATVGERLVNAAAAIRDNPALAGDPDYAFLLSGGFFKMGWFGRSTAKNPSSLDKTATNLGSNATGGKMYGASGLMHGKGDVKWSTGAGDPAEADFRKGWDKDTELIRENFTTKAKAYNEIHAQLLRFLQERPDIKAAGTK